MPNLVLVNGGAVNGAGVDTPDQAMANHGINTCYINGHALNTPDRLEYTLSASIMSIAQEVQYLESGSGLICSIEQAVTNSGVGSICSIAQIVYEDSATTFLGRNGYYPHLYINGRRIPDNQVHNVIQITRVENDAAQMMCTLLLPPGPVDLTSYEGQPVILNVQTAAGIFRRYTGRINIPDLDLLTGKLTLSCTDNRRELINARPPLVTGIGWYSEPIFGVPKDKAQELDYRLTTVPYTVNFNAFGVPTISSIFADSVADYTYTQSDIYRDERRDPRVLLTPRKDIVNTINIDFEYRYQRLYRTQCVYSWGTEINCNFLTYGFTFTRRDNVTGAAESCGWPLVSPVVAETSATSGWKSCGFGIGAYTIGFSWVELSGENVAATEDVRGSDGQLHTTNVVDANGQQVYNTVTTSAVDHSQEYCDGAQWTCAFRWAQQVAENYTISVSAPQSINRFGVVSQDMSSGVDSQYDPSKWTDITNLARIENPPPGFTKVGTSTVYYANEIRNLGEYNNAMYTIINKARTTILKAHRGNKVVFQTPLKPLLDLVHTVEIDAVTSRGVEIRAKGKVYKIVETYPISEGREAISEITLALSVADGSALDTPMIAPNRPTNNLTAPSYTIALSSYYGVDPNSANYIDKAGYFGNRYLEAPSTITGLPRQGTKTQFAEQFRVDTPKIDRAYSDNISQPVVAAYSVELVNDDLEVVV